MQSQLEKSFLRKVAESGYDPRNSIVKQKSAIIVARIIEEGEHIKANQELNTSTSFLLRKQAM